jgi:hypothetical protein
MPWNCGLEKADNLKLDRICAKLLAWLPGSIGRVKHRRLRGIPQVPPWVKMGLPEEGLDRV